MLEAEVAENAHRARVNHLRSAEYKYIDSLLCLYDAGIIDAEQFAKKTMDVMWSHTSALGVEAEAERECRDKIKLRNLVFGKELGGANEEDIGSCREGQG